MALNASGNESSLALHSIVELCARAIELRDKSLGGGVTAFDWDREFLSLQTIAWRAQVEPLLQRLSALCLLCAERESSRSDGHFSVNVLTVLPTLRAEIEHEVHRLCVSIMGVRRSDAKRANGGQ